MKTFTATKIKGKLFFIFPKGKVRIKSSWVKSGERYPLKDIKVAGKIRDGGWLELDWEQNDFKPDKDWTQFVAIVRCRCCNKFDESFLK